MKFEADFIEGFPCIRTVLNIDFIVISNDYAEFIIDSPACVWNNSLKDDDTYRWNTTRTEVKKGPFVFRSLAEFKLLPSSGDEGANIVSDGSLFCAGIITTVNF